MCFTWKALIWALGLGFISGIIVTWVFSAWHDATYILRDQIPFQQQIEDEGDYETDKEFLIRMNNHKHVPLVRTSTNRKKPNRKKPHRSTSNLTGKTLATMIAAKYGVDYKLVHAVISHESGWRRRIVSDAGAIGYMQIMPNTGKGFCGLSRKELYNGEKNINCGVMYLKKLLLQFGDVRVALCAYNAGPTRVSKRGGCPPYKETINYRNKIMKTWNSKTPNKWWI